MQPRFPHIKHHIWTDIFSSDARRIVAENVLSLAERFDYRMLTTGHLLIDPQGPGRPHPVITATLRDVAELAAAAVDLLPRVRET